MATNKVDKKPKTLPKGVRQQPSGRFLIDITVEGERRTATASSIEEAVKRRETLRAELIQSVHQNKQTATSWTLQQAFERALFDYWRGKSSEQASTINATAVLNFFGSDKLVLSLTQVDVDAYIDHLETARNADATINRKLSALSRMLEAAKRRGHVPQQNISLTRRREREGRIRFLTAKEEENLLRALEHLDRLDHREAVIILLDTGFRTGELWKLEAAHVDFVRNTLTLWETKNGRPRTIPMTARVKDIIARRCQLYPEGRLFPGSGKAWLRASWDAVRHLMNMDNDPNFVPHILRHTCCSRLVQRGVPLVHVKEWMGHQSIQTTMRYAHLTPHDLFALVSVLEGGDQARWEQQAQSQQQPEPQS